MTSVAKRDSVMQRDGSAYLGMGIYTLGEASRLSGVSPQRIRRWLLGYSYNREGQTRSQVPVFRGQIPPFDSKLELGFRDLLEIRIVNAFADAGLGLPTIRKALDRASRLIDNDHPFSTARFRTDGRDIFFPGEKSKIGIHDGDAIEGRRQHDRHANVRIRLDRTVHQHDHSAAS